MPYKKAKGKGHYITREASVASWRSLRLGVHCVIAFVAFIKTVKRKAGRGAFTLPKSGSLPFDELRISPYPVINLLAGCSKTFRCKAPDGSTSSP